jgi:hypothetical protein
MKNIWALFCGMALLCLVTGCASTHNGFSQFYQDKAGSGITNAPPYSGITKVINSSDPKTDSQEAFRNGYFLIGESAFTGPPQSESALMYQAKKVGADLVLNNCVYLGSQQVARPVLHYNPGQTYTTSSSGTVNANAWGSGGYAYGTGNYYGNSTTTSPGTFDTQIIQTTVQRYQYDAGFFRKAKGPPISGIIPSPLPPEMREKMQRNTGVVVWVIRYDSPAFKANILEGDVILKINGDDVVSVADYIPKMLKYAGQKVDFELWRKGENKTISVQLNIKPE